MEFLKIQLKKNNIIVISAIILVAALTRLLPHIPNVTPIAAMALFGGAMIEDKRLALIIPLTAMLISDIIIGFHPMMFSVYLSFVLTVGIGFWLKNNKKFYTIIFSSVTSALIFYLLTNFNYWSDGSLYPKTLEGLRYAYIMGLLFLRNTLLGDVFYSMVLFYGYEYLTDRRYQLSH